MTEFESVDAAAVIGIFLLLLIGVGPKIALVPFLDLTADMLVTEKVFGFLLAARGGWTTLAG